MGCFRVMTDKYNWTIKDKSTDDATVFLGNHFYKSPTTSHDFIVIDDAVINLDKVIAIEKVIV